MRSLASALAFALVLASPFSTARADEKALCIAASEQGQEERDNGNYRRASEDFSTCARESCPALVRDDCVQWSASLEDAWPSVVFSAKDDKGNVVLDVKVSIDGERSTSKLDGKSLRLDPGEHLIGYEADGYLPGTEHVVVRPGEKERAIDLLLATPPPPLKTEPPIVTTLPPVEARRPSMWPQGMWAIGFGSLAVVSFGSELIFGLSGLSERASLLSQPCAKTATCPKDKVDSIRTQYLIADVSLGAGIVSAGVAAYFLVSSLSHPTHAAPSSARKTHLDVAPLPGGAGATLSGAF